MKRTSILLGILFLMVGIALTACQDATTTPEAGLEKAGYPPPEVMVPMEEIAYPIAEEDLPLLLRTWNLIARSEDNQSVEPGGKTLKFFANGAYQTVTDGATAAGVWTVETREDGTAVLTLDQALKHEIVALNEAMLRLRMTQDDTLIDEQYLATD